MQVTKQEEKLTQKEDELRSVVEKLDVQTKECQEIEKKFRQVCRRRTAPGPSAAEGFSVAFSHCFDSNACRKEMEIKSIC